MGIRDHIPDDVLLDFVENRADSAATARVCAHLECGCGVCGNTLGRMTRSLAALSADPGPEPPEAVLQRAVALFTSRFPKKESTWARIVAALTFDSRLQPVAVGARDGVGSSFQMLFEADGVDIDLLCEPGEVGWRIMGQALVVDAPELDWKVSARGPDVQFQTDADALGEFCFRDLAPGVYDLSLRVAGREIVLPSVELPRQSARPGLGGSSYRPSYYCS